MRNAVYSGQWVTQAKRRFSKTNCVAYQQGRNYMAGATIRQAYLETVLKWISRGDINAYMVKHRFDPDCDELWQYYQDVIHWVQTHFTERRKEMKGVAWGDIYNKFRDAPFKESELRERVRELMKDSDVQSKAGIYWYVFDGDGVDNYAEFWHQCDPALADTDGDGYSDYVEIAGQAVGKTWYDPLVRATYVHEEPDANANGVPDHWEGSGYVYGFTDANGDGLPDGVPFPDVGGDNFDVAVTVTTSRSALLTWGDGVTNGIVLAPCTGLVVRVRIAKAVETNIKLAAGLPNDGSDGLWDASYTVAWASGRNQQTEGNRIRLGDGSIIDIDGEATVSFRGEVISVPMRGGNGGDYTPSPIPLRLKWLDVNCTDGLCWEHDPGGFFATAIYTNVAPPFVWYVNGYLVPNVYGDILDGYDILGHWNGFGSPEVRCVATNGPLHEAILVEDSDYAWMGHCPPSTTNIIGAAWTSTHNPTNATDHVPEVYPESITYYGPNCPLVTNLCAKIGWDHDRVNTRNLPVISTDDWRDEQTDHCLAIKWVSGGYVNLFDYLCDMPDDIKNGVSFTANGRAVPSGMIKYDRPSDLSPCVYHVVVYHVNCTEPLDYLWLTVYAPASSKSFLDWEAANTNLSWTTTLPQPYSHISFSASGTPLKPTGGTPELWKEPKAISSFLHHNASFDMRSDNPGEHGHQCTFDATGNLITKTIAAGTADLYKPMTIRWFVEQHRKNDVLPYLRSLVLDGNPVSPVSELVPTQLNRPCLYQGKSIETYLRLRPIIPTGIQPGD